jgi:protocatechuate 3,4-dioxygenase, alpha subunit
MPTPLPQTPTQTVGPYFAYGLTPAQYGYGWTSLAGPVLADETSAGERIVIEGQVLDGAGSPITDALIEIRQADASVSYANPGANAAFRGFGRCGTGTWPEGLFRFETVKPGKPAPGEAPHVHVIVQMRGLLTHLFTRFYFADDPANDSDPVLALVPAERRATLIARLAAPGRYRFDIRMQGDAETVFFDL